MEKGLREEFEGLWRRFFAGAELPICFYYAAEPAAAEAAKPATGHRCLIADLAQVRRGKSLAFDVASVGCFGGKRYLGFSQETMPNFEFFLSCGIPGKLEGERYKKSPELVKEAFKHVPSLQAPAPFIVFKRWDNLQETDEPEVVIFFAPPDVLSGLFTLAGFDEAEPNAVIAPFGAGCATIVQYPYLEARSAHPRAVLGMFDVSARPCVPPDLLTFAVPMAKFARMVANMPESFLITPSWAKVRKRMARQEGSSTSENR
jgi:uncharacterized protein (DUF169 family)